VRHVEWPLSINQEIEAEDIDNAGQATASVDGLPYSFLHWNILCSSTTT
jgi:hypothetical protein